MNSLHLQQNVLQAPLFFFVFTSKLVVGVVLLLIGSLLLQPVERAFADEVTTSATEAEQEVQPSVSVEIAEDTIKPTTDVPHASEESSNDSEVVDTAKVENNDENATDVASTGDSDGGSNEVVDIMIDRSSTSPTILESDEISDEAVDVSSTSTQTASSTSNENENTVNASSTSSNTTQELQATTSSTTLNNSNEPNQTLETTVQPNHISSSTVDESNNYDSSTPSPVADVQPSTSVASTSVVSDEVSKHISDANRYQFSKQDCVEVGNGAYYCSAIEQTKVYQEDGVFAAPDTTGDMEIFVRVDGAEVQLSNNLVDDSSPYFDPLSNRVVWQTHQNDRYQIVSYSFDDKATTMLTNEHYNNMEPVAYGDVTLWQAWINNNWEIIMHDGKTTKQLTHNDMHDIAPHVRGGYTVWQTQFSDGWKVAVYDAVTDTVEYVDGIDTFGVAENPRFVLVFDQVDGNGDVQTVGYDFDTKSTIHLGSLPQEVPDELPEPEQTGETRALIQAKPTSRDTKEKVSSDTDLKPSVGSTTPVTTATTSDTGTGTTTDLIIEPYEPETATTTDEIVVVNEVTDEFPIATSTVPIEDPVVTSIPDVVIPPITGSSTDVAG